MYWRKDGIAKDRIFSVKNEVEIFTEVMTDMSKVLCPECGKILSQYAESCPNCSFPIAKYVQNAHLTDFSKTFVCPKCGSFNTSTDIVATIRCDFCGTPMFQTNEATTDTISNTSWPKTEDEIDSYIYYLL